MPIIRKTGSGGGGGGGGGDSTYTNTYANIPGVSNDGDLFFPSDGFSVYRDTGAAWVPWGPIFPLTDPPSAGWSWDNQNTAAVSSTEGGILLSSADQGGGLNLNLRVRNAPAAPYTITACFLGASSIGAGAWTQPRWGLCFRQSSDGKIVYFGTRLGEIGQIKVEKWTDSTTFSANYVTYEVPMDSGVFPIWYRIEDDNTDRKSYWSTDGQYFHQLHIVVRTDFLTADQVGFMIAPINHSVSLRLISWEEA